MTKTSYLQNETQQSTKVICWVNVKSFVTAGRYLFIPFPFTKSLNIQRKEWEIKLPIVTNKSTLRCKEKYFLRKIHFELYRQGQAFGTLVVC